MGQTMAKSAIAQCNHLFMNATQLKQSSIRYGWVAFDSDSTEWVWRIGMHLDQLAPKCGKIWLCDGPNHGKKCYCTMQSSFYECHTTQTKLHQVWMGGI